MIPEARRPGPFRSLGTAVVALVLVAAGEALDALRRWRARP